MLSLLEMISPRELLVLVVVIVLLSLTNLWPRVLEALRAVQGVATPSPESTSSQAPSTRKDDLDVMFKMLGISPSSSWEEIERAYRKKAKLHHPDLGGDEDAMRALNDAYAYLKRKAKR